jgi:hypothetical protein
MSCGEELWKRFLPKYLESLGAPVTAVGFYGTLQDFVDATYQYPGGWLTDRFGAAGLFCFSLDYFVRSVSIAPAAFVGGLLWRVSPDTLSWLTPSASLEQSFLRSTLKRSFREQQEN